MNKKKTLTLLGRAAIIILAIVFAFSVFWGLIAFGKWVSYELFYEDMNTRTICELVKPAALQDPTTCD